MLRSSRFYDQKTPTYNFFLKGLQMQRLSASNAMALQLMQRNAMHSIQCNVTQCIAIYAMQPSIATQWIPMYCNANTMYCDSLCFAMNCATIPATVA